MRTREAEVAAFNYLRVARVATRLDCSRSQVIGLIDAGELEAVNIGLGERPEWRVAPESLEALLEKRSNKHAA